MATENLTTWDKPYNGRLLEDHPGESLRRIRSLLALYASVDWDSPIIGAQAGATVLMDEVLAALTVVENQLETMPLAAFQGGDEQ